MLVCVEETGAKMLLPFQLDSSIMLNFLPAGGRGGISLSAQQQSVGPKEQQLLFGGSEKHKWLSSSSGWAFIAGRTHGGSGGRGGIGE